MSRTLRSALALVAFVATVRFAGAQTTAPARTAIVVAPTTPVTMVAFYYALNQKMFEQAGLDVTVQPATSGAASLTGVVAGATQIGWSNLLTLSIARSKGVPIQLIAPASIHVTVPADRWDPDGTVIVAPDSAVKTAQDLEGRTVAVSSLADLYGLSMNAWLEKAGADPAKVKFVEIPQPAMLAAVLEKRVDAATLAMPFQLAAQAAGARSIGNQFDAIGANWLTGAWVAAEPWLAQHRDAAIQFARVLRTAAAYTNSHQDQLAPTIASFTKLPEDTVRKMPAVQIPLSLRPAALQPIINVGVKYHAIAAPFNAQDFIYPGVP